MKALSYIRCYIRHHHGKKAGDPAGGEKRAQKVHIDMIETTLKHLRNLWSALTVWGLEKTTAATFYSKGKKALMM